MLLSFIKNIIINRLKFYEPLQQMCGRTLKVSPCQLRYNLKFLYPPIQWRKNTKYYIERIISQVLCLKLIYVNLNYYVFVLFNIYFLAEKKKRFFFILFCCTPQYWKIFYSRMDKSEMSLGLLFIFFSLFLGPEYHNLIFM